MGLFLDRSFRDVIIRDSVLGFNFDPGSSSATAFTQYILWDFPAKYELWPKPWRCR
ncbi:Uncharacterized protein BM_BM514 [Brugia malayi]|uniref:Bm514 n=1 Tax=Brugia malayi TaxID=6279 RepID=A0A0J9XWF7_BRUMA|nr:Uncharacterized protein BM_BM514 [Brugia malayi]CDP97130.1 Bm514 [Brugia malayi]VIP00349.1 Uncharacterized protein BM_BM514 [Brugia malayi]